MDGGSIGAGDGVLSPSAVSRLRRPPGPPLRPPPLADPTAIAAWRAAVNAAWLDGDPSAEACGHREAVVGGVRVLRTWPDRDGPLVVYLHGGGYALGSPEVALPITERLARSVSVVSVGYRLAPEHPFPAGVEDATAVYRALSLDAPDRPVVLAGDSAGANLALSVALAVRDGAESAVPPPAGLLLLSPHVDHAPRPEPGGSPADRPSDVDAEAGRWLTDAYRGSLAADDPRLSPVRAELAGLSPMLIQVGTADTSLDQAVRLARRARLAGVDVDLDVWAGLWHTWHYHRDLPEADRALSEAAEFALRLSAPGP
ncbi:MAG: alpha/beta hydrolase [Actinomycetota bacterium]